MAYEPIILRLSSQGPRGPQGDTPTVRIGTVSTLPAGSSATVTASTSSDGKTVTISFGIPKGADGIDTISSLLGDLAWLDTVNYATQVTNKPTLGALAFLNSVNYETQVTNKPNFGTLAWSQITNKPNFGRLATLDAVDYNTAQIKNKPILGILAALNSVDYNTQIDNKPILGALASQDAVDYYTQIDNLPHFKRLAFRDAVDYQSDEIYNKPEPLSATLDRIRTLYPDFPLGMLLSVYLADETLYLGTGIAIYDSDTETLHLPKFGNDELLFRYNDETVEVNIVADSWLTKANFDAKIDEAPRDGNIYARRNGGWVKIQTIEDRVVYDDTNEALVALHQSDFEYDTENEALVVLDENITYYSQEEAMLT